MTGKLRKLLASIYSSIVLISCGPTSTLYRADNPNKIYCGTLDEATDITLRQLLSSHTTFPLKDTLIIKYDYNNESCWNILDQADDAHIMAFVTRHKERMQVLQTSRPDVSVFNFREPGNSLNKIKKWDNSIIIDSSRQLMNLLFKERSTCGNSIIVLPDKTFVFLRSDSHSEALELTQDQLLKYLTRL